MHLSFPSTITFVFPLSVRPLRRRPCPFRHPDPLHRRPRDQINVSLAFETPHLEVFPQSLVAARVQVVVLLVAQLPEFPDFHRLDAAPGLKRRDLARK
jgi:hypothetical protein